MNITVILALLMMAPALARGAEPKVLTSYDVVYAKPGGTELKLDIARPGEGEGPFPVVLVIHGGAWRAGNKSDVRPVLGEMAAHGFVAVSPQYRFCPKAKFPAQVHDVKAAVRWVKAHAKDYKADPAHVGAVGFSAGAHLALMLGLTGPSDGLEGEVAEGSPDSTIQAVVNYFGPTDLAAKDIPDVSMPLIADFLGGTREEKPKECAQASPLTHVSKGDPPVLTYQGTKDPLVPYTQAETLADALTKAEVPGRVELLIGGGHGWGGDDMTHTRDGTIAFFDKYLKAKPGGH